MASVEAQVADYIQGLRKENPAEAAEISQANANNGVGNWVQRKDLGGPAIPHWLSRITGVRDNDVIPLK